MHIQYPHTIQNSAGVVNAPAPLHTTPGLRPLIWGFMAIFAFFFTACEKEENTQPPPPPLRLEYMEIEEHAASGLLYLHGYFGDSTANTGIWINNLQLSGKFEPDGHILSWEPYLIKCAVPAANLKEGAGKVKVSNGAQVSNTRTLNRWKGTITFHRPDEGTLKRSIWIDIVLRADADAHKALPFSLAQSSRFGAGSKLQYSISGQGSSNYNIPCSSTMTVQLEQATGWLQHDFSPSGPTSQESYFWSDVHFENDHFKVNYLDVFKLDATKLTRNVVSCGPPGTIIHPISLHGLPYELQAINLSLAPGTKAIKPGRITLMAGTEMGLIWDAGQVPQYECYVDWGTMEAEF
jgi:hypothetical protein